MANAKAHDDRQWQQQAPWEQRAPDGQQIIPGRAAVLLEGFENALHDVAPGGGLEEAWRAVLDEDEPGHNDDGDYCNCHHNLEEGSIDFLPLPVPRETVG